MRKHEDQSSDFLNLHKSQTWPRAPVTPALGGGHRKLEALERLLASLPSQKYFFKWWETQSQENKAKKNRVRSAMSSLGFCEHSGTHIHMPYAHSTHTHMCRWDRKMSNRREKTNINVPKDYVGTRTQGPKRNLVSCSVHEIKWDKSWYIYLFRLTEIQYRSDGSNERQWFGIQWTMYHFQTWYQLSHKSFLVQLRWI